MMFIDGSNLFHGCKCYSIENGEDHFRIDMIKLREKLLNNRRLIRAYYYCSIPIKGDPMRINNQEGFYRYLEYNGFKVIKKPLRLRTEKFKCNKCKHEIVFEKQVEKGVDVALVTDMLSLGISERYDTAILIAGDLDYMRAIEELQRLGITTEVAYFRSGIGSELIRCADKFIPLESIIEEIRKK